MLAHVVDWLELTVRWIHVITGIAWIGTSFYFNWLNDSIRPPKDAPEGVSGELWSVHGGGFYRVLKYKVAPSQLPETLHWFKWEAYFTWITGFTLLVLVYYLGADVFLLDADHRPVGELGAIGVGIGTLVVGWVLYDLLCKSPLGDKPALFGTLGIAAVAGVAYGLMEVFSSRGAFIHVGALIGTIMAANVFFVIIPNQKRMVAVMEKGGEPDAEEGRRAAMRSRHNNYLTLPVLFIMVSNHYPITFEHSYGWALLAGIAVVGAVVRHWFNLKHMGHMNRWVLPVAAAGMIAMAFVTAPEAPPPGLETDNAGIGFQTVSSILTRRCAECHSEHPTNPLFNAPPAGIKFQTPAEIGERAAKIHETVVQTGFMPPGNVTGMTRGERDLVGRWFDAGASLE